MKKAYVLSVNNTESFAYNESSMPHCDAIQLSENQWHVLHQNVSYIIKLKNADFLKKEYTLEINGRFYTVNIANGLDVLIKEMGFTFGSSKQVSHIKAPMPGLILEINVQPGTQVQENDPLMILEAMKMENVIVSPRSGIIKKIAVTKGAAVDKGHLLIEFE